MNERIKELSKQAWEWAEQQEYKDATQEFSDILEQKFAELIIRECLAECSEFESWYNATPKQISDNIKKHFGVK
jgi:hypothetical protein